MNKKILTLSLVAVATIGISFAASYSFAKTNNNYVAGHAGSSSKSVVFKSGCAKNIREGAGDYGETLFDLEAPVAFNSEDYTLVIKDIAVSGTNIVLNGDHLMYVEGDSWYFSIDSIDLIGTHNGFQNINYLKLKSGQTDQYDVIQSRSGADYYVDYDADLDWTSIEYVYESRGSFGNVTPLVIDAITISYTC